METRSAEPMPQILFASAGRGWDGLEAAFVRVPRGKAEAPGGDRHVIGMHFGRSVNADCTVGERRVRGPQKPGDMDFVPAGIEGSWEDDAPCHVLRLSLDRSLVVRAAEDLDMDPMSFGLVPLLRVRDARLEALLHAIKADLEASAPSDPLYIGYLASALAIRLVDIATDGRPDIEGLRAADMPAHELERVVAFIQANLGEKLSLEDLAKVAGLSTTRLKAAFRNGTGMPVHQYVMRRRVEYARDLFTTTMIPASEIALAAGFAHQSHMTTTMRRILGYTPSEVPRPVRTLGPILQKIRPILSEGIRIDP